MDIWLEEYSYYCIYIRINCCIYLSSNYCIYIRINYCIYIRINYCIYIRQITVFINKGIVAITVAVRVIRLNLSTEK